MWYEFKTNEAIWRYGQYFFISTTQPLKKHLLKNITEFASFENYKNTGFNLTHCFVKTMIKYLSKKENISLYSFNVSSEMFSLAFKIAASLSRSILSSSSIINYLVFLISFLFCLSTEFQNKTDYFLTKLHHIPI